MEENGTHEPGYAGQEEFQALAARVLELERAVALLQGNQASARRSLIRDRLPALAPPPPPPPPALAADALSPPPATVAGPKKTLEDRLGAQVFNMVGIVALIFATAYGLKLAIEHGYIGPVARVLIGLAAGAGLVLWSETFRHKGLAAFSYSLKAVGSAVLYLSLWASFQLYHLLPAGVALAAMVLVTAWNAYMAWAQDAELLGWYALLGGFLTPLLLRTGGNHEGFLFTYVGAIDLAMVLLVRRRPWTRLLLAAFLGSSGFFIGWYNVWYRWADGSGPFTETLLFTFMFFLIWVAVTLKGWMREPAPVQAEQPSGEVIVPVLLPLLNAAFTGITLYGLLVDSGKNGLRPWLMVALAAVYLALVRLQRTAVASAMHLAMGVVFLTIAIPLKASGHSLTTAWLVEGFVLFWASTRFAAEEKAAARVLWVLSAGGYILGLGSLTAHWTFGAISGMGAFFNRDLGAAAVAIASLAAAVTLAVRERESGRNTEATVATGLLAIDLVAVLLCFRELASTSSEQARGAAFSNASFWTAVAGLVVLAAVAWVALRLRRLDDLRFRDLDRLAAATTIAFNLLAILSIKREIGALWHRGQEDLQRSLAISGFLMAYGAALLAVGFWRRTAFVRWQGLVLLLFTICKVFLYDIGGLSAGYRVASFMGLGAVLMGISYAYQKDWLGLKDKSAPAPAAASLPAEKERQL